MIARKATLGAVLGVTVSTVWGQALTVDMIEQMGNNSLFTRWRPFSHFLAPAGWMNVPNFLHNSKNDLIISKITNNFPGPLWAAVRSRSRPLSSTLSVPPQPC
jgi:hypothetical protein